ncbi:MAG: hypothetical protein KAW52_00600 [candidate division Zixibacteria bacterium]|nr:hypothetical protein [candidate division Zixibacteria bacterium]
MFNDIITFIKNNISWIKDLFTIVLVFTATVVSILAYRRARATVFQPIRNEVIKKQSQILSELLSFLSDYDDNIEDGLDYMRLAGSNAVLSLKESGFILADNGEINKSLKDDIHGWIHCGESKILKDVKFIGIFNDEKKDKKDFEQTGKERYENAKKGIIEIDKIHVTVRHTEFMKKWSKFSNDPFLPSNVKNILKKISQEIATNLTENLKNVLEKFVKDCCKKHLTGENISKFSPIGVYNEFNHNRIHHRQSIIILKNEIRKYLRIDEKW